MTETNYDSEFCGSLPIQLINLIQPYGVLVVVSRENNTIIQVSENAGEVFGKPFREIIHTNLDNYRIKESPKLANENGRLATDKIPAVWEINQTPYLTLVHQHEKFLIIEIDLLPYDAAKQLSFVSVYKDIKHAMSLIQSSSTVQEVAENCAREIRRISGYDKVMIYRFDTDWNGMVIAEEKEKDMEAYHGITFPASDIPQQARKLYHSNAFRFIPNRDYQPVKLFPVINPLTQSFLDLSDCNLRGVAGVHLEYLKNMNVVSSLSARILCGEELWGLIACHHKASKGLSFEMRSVFELLSNIVSARITGLMNNDLHVFNLKIKEQYRNIVEDAYLKGNSNLPSTLLSGDPDLLTLFNAQGAAFSFGGKIYSKGLIPDKEQLRELMLWLHARELRQVFATERLPFEYDQAHDFKAIASGMLVIPVNYEQDEYVLLFRPEVVRVINWGGNPEERIRFEEGSKNYHPRSSFKKWQQTVQGTSRSWRPEEIAAAESLRSFIYEFSN